MRSSKAMSLTTPDAVSTCTTSTETAFGIAPRYAEINWNGLDFSAEQFRTVTSIDKSAWAEELKLHTEHFDKLAYHLPQELLATKAALEKRLAA